MAEDDPAESGSVDRLLSRAEGAGGDVSTAGEVVRELERLLTAAPNPHTLYALAYALYLHPDRPGSVAIQDRIEQLLLQVLDSQPHDYLSWLYLGHNRYDRGDYPAAYRYFEKARAEAPPTYIGLKAQEMLACSRMQQDGIAAGLDDLEAFVDAAQRQQSEDIFPQELARVLTTRVDHLSRADQDRLQTAAGRLDRAGRLGDWFTDIVRQHTS